MYKNLENILSRTSEKLWKELREKSRNSKWTKFDWYNVKSYKRQEINDGSVKQEDKRGNKEVPYERELFFCDRYESKRFSLGKEYPVAYFANGIQTCYAETDEDFRDNEDLSWKEDMSPYLKGEHPSNADTFLYPINYGIKEDALLLDLSEESHAYDLIKFIEKEACDTEGTFFSTIILSRPKGKDATYYYTQLLAKEAFKQGFHGIVYKSVRDFKDINNVQDKNLVLFDKTKLTSPPSKGKFSGFRVVP